MIERISNNGEEMAIIIRSTYKEEGIHFLTPDDYSQQLAYMNHKKGHLIAPHFHNLVPRTVHYTQEVLVIKSGKLRVDFYDESRQKINDTILSAGDIILLCSGGHGFEVLEEVEMVEIKQGPYIGENDKTRFEPVVRESSLRHGEKIEN